jgi:peptidyl-prolyl cis-trans isomerase A (cyclophilin A)
MLLGMFGCAASTTTTTTPPTATAPNAALAALARESHYVRIVTTVGNIDLELDAARAPVGVANFLGYANRGEYNATIFHRTVPGFVIQGGGYTTALVELKGSPTIVNEWQNGLKNVRGTIAWARDTEPNSATREFYINLADNARLDTPRELTGKAGYAVFGHVVAGMDVVDKIASGDLYELPAREMKHIPVTPAIVLRVEIQPLAGKGAAK